MKRIIFIIILMTPACSNEKAASSRGRLVVEEVANADSSSASTDGAVDQNLPVVADGGSDDSSSAVSIEPVLSVDDLYLYFADDRKGSVDSALTEISSDELRIAVTENLGDNGLVEKLMPLYMEAADLDHSGNLNFNEFLNAGIEKDGQEDIVKGIIETDKQTLFNFMDFDHDNAIGSVDLLRLVKVRVWRLRTWSGEISTTAPPRLKLLAKTGYASLQALVAKTYNSGAITPENFQKLSTAIKAKLK